MPVKVSPTQLRRVVTNTWAELTRWFTENPRLYGLPHPEQQLLFEYASRCRESIRSLSADVTWDSLLFDASGAANRELRILQAAGTRPHIHIETGALFRARERSPAAPDVAINVHVLRSLPARLDLDDNGHPLNLNFTPLNIHAQARALEESVQLLHALAERAYDGYLFVLYLNPEGRETAVEARSVAHWASWQRGPSGVAWTTRHFRPKGAPAQS